MGGKSSAKIDLLFFLLNGIAQESVFVEKDERTPPTENQSCKTRHGQVRMALRPNDVAAKENQPYATCKTRRGHAGANAKRRPVGRCITTVELSRSNGERPAAQTDKRTPQLPSCSVECC